MAGPAKDAKASPSRRLGSKFFKLLLQRCRKVSAQSWPFKLWKLSCKNSLLKLSKLSRSSLWKVPVSKAAVLKAAVLKIVFLKAVVCQVSVLKAVASEAAVSKAVVEVVRL